jgi:hypothetical protein
MKSRIREARSIVAQMPCSEAVHLRRLLSIPCSPRRRARLIVRERLSLGSLIVAETYRQALSELRRAA